MSKGFDWEALLEMPHRDVKARYQAMFKEPPRSPNKTWMVNQMEEEHGRRKVAVRAPPRVPVLGRARRVATVRRATTPFAQSDVDVEQEFREPEEAGNALESADDALAITSFPSEEVPLTGAGTSLPEPQTPALLATATPEDRVHPAGAPEAAPLSVPVPQTRAVAVTEHQPEPASQVNPPASAPSAAPPPEPNVAPIADPTPSALPSQAATALAPPNGPTLSEAQAWGRFRFMTVEQLRALYAEKLGRSTSSTHKSYLVARIREAEKGKIRVGPVVPGARLEGAFAEADKTLPLTLSALAIRAMDGVWRRTGFTNRMSFMRTAIREALTKRGAEDAAALIQEKGAI